MARKDLIRITASFNGVPAGVFRTFEGGDVTFGDRKTVAGAGETERARGGRKKVANVTIAREDDGSFDFKALKQKRSVSATVTRQPLDDDLNPLGPAETYTGKVINIVGAGADAEADADTNDVTIEISCDGEIA